MGWETLYTFVANFTSFLAVPSNACDFVVKRFELGDSTHNFEGESTIRLRLPVYGPTGRGHYCLVVEKREASAPGRGSADEAVLVRSDLELDETKSLLPDQFEGKKMVIYARERHGDIKSFIEGGGGGNANGSTVESGYSDTL